MGQIGQPDEGGTGRPAGELRRHITWNLRPAEIAEHGQSHGDGRVKVGA